MPTSSTGAGLLGPALHWSMTGLWTGAIGWLVFVTFEIGSDRERLSPQDHRLISVTLAMLVLGSLAVQLTGRVIRGQRRIIAMLEADRSAADLPPDNVRAFELGRKLERSAQNRE